MGHDVPEVQASLPGRGVGGTKMAQKKDNAKEPDVDRCVPQRAGWTARLNPADRARSAGSRDGRGGGSAEERAVRGAIGIPIGVLHANIGDPGRQAGAAGAAGPAGEISDGDL